MAAIYFTVIGSVAMKDYTEAGTIVFLFTIAEWLESRASHKACFVFSIGYISVKTTAVAEDCVVAKMAKLVEEAQNSKSNTQRFIDKCAQFYTPAIIVVSAAIAVIPVALRVQNLHHWFHLALVVLVSACPCSLILSTPVASFCALTNAATSGLLVKGGDYLETLSKIRITAFDKTGTLTRGEFIVTDFQPLSQDISLDTLLYWVSSIESKSSHPMAAALVDYGRSHSIEPNPETVEDYQNFPGEGIYGRVDGRDIYIGSKKISVRAHGTVPTLEGNMMKGKTIGFVYSGATPAGIFSLSDAYRTGVPEAVDELKSMRIKVAMLTGDNQAVAIHVQEQLGNRLDLVHAELLPKDKARIIKEFKKEGATAMIGDGVNDAPALATADIGISMGISGSALATETGHVVLMSNDIRKIPKVIKLARKAHRKVIENVILSISTKTAILALAFAGHPLVWAAVLADVGTCLLVICNSMLLLRGKHKDGRKCCKSSVTMHTNKHGSKACHCDSSHKHQDASLDKKVQKACEPPTCSSERCASRCHSGLVKMDSSSNSRGSDKCEYSGRTHDGSAIREAKCCNQRSCHLVNHKIEAQNLPRKCCSSHGSLDLGKETNALHGAKQCHQGHLHQYSSSTPEKEQGIKNDHCHSTYCGENHVDIHGNNLTAFGNLVEYRCLESLNQTGYIDSHEPTHTAIDITMNPDEVHGCASVEKRELGGCCKSYMKECCGKHGRFRPCLTEIITE
ncbi:hypothetical protein Gohar_006667 [Gossypium harknessii]|uniref:HMA domain-containing protein n=1 Tax=Gossypium harknessii TaxID=34285 RepID=A0A7J9GE60_9ROSI|nr:hypothetical protein [Gossypium harknessii]